MLQQTSDTSSGSALGQRLFMGVLMSVLLAGAMFLDHRLGFDPAFAVILLVGVLLAAREFYALAEAAGARPFTRFGMTICGALIVLHWLTLPDVLLRLAGVTLEFAAPQLLYLVWFVALAGAFFIEARKKDESERAPIASIGSTLLGVLYVYYLASFLLVQRHMGVGPEGGLVSGGEGWPLLGLILVVQTIAVAKMMDIGAYFTGRTLGRHKMAPRVSPKKTWEGLIGGTIAAGATGYLLHVFVLSPYTTVAWSALHGVSFGVLVGLSGQMGDLAESLLKRSVGAKDTGAMLPGFGGVLDMVDSLLGAAPVAYAFYLFLL